MPLFCLTTLRHLTLCGRSSPSSQKSITESGLEPVPPKGFIYHETRCGSTLAANMLAALPPSRVFSEAKPPVQVNVSRELVRYFMC